MRRFFTAVTVVAAVVTGLTGRSLAEEAKAGEAKAEEPGTSAPVSEPKPEPKPLALRPQKPLTLQSESKSSGLKWSLLLIPLMGVGLWAKKKGLLPKRPELPTGELHVVQRTSLSGKASLVVVEIGGETLLLGVTAHTVSLLTSLGAEPPVDERALHGARAEIRSLRDLARRSDDDSPRPHKAAPAPGIDAQREPIEHQLAGLLKRKGLLSG